MPTLYVVATPIGNLSDMSPRAIETLRSVQLIAAEDTRVTMKLLNAFDISTPLTSCHEHNERSKAVQIAERMLAENIDVAVTTDAGTPCISDPGSVLVREATERGIPAVAVSGPTAMASALSVSGMDISEFTFYGFLPRQKNELREKLTDMARHSKIAVVHESPHRVIELLQQVQAVLPHTLCQRQLRPDQEIRADSPRPRGAGTSSAGGKSQGGQGRVLSLPALGGGGHSRAGERSGRTFRWRPVSSTA